MRAHALFVGLVLLLLPFAWAQTVVEGTVHDKVGALIAGATVELKRSNGSQVVAQTTAADGHFRFNAVEAGGYRVQATAPSFFPSAYELVLRPRQPIAVDIELEHREAVAEQVEVKEHYLTVDPQKTGSSYTFTRADLERLPDPLTESTNDLANNLMPGASESHDNFLAVRGTEFSLHEFLNGVSFLDHHSLRRDHEWPWRCELPRRNL